MNIEIIFKIGDKGYKMKYLSIKDDCRQKLNILEDKVGHDSDDYQSLVQKWWRLDDYLDYKGMKTAGAVFV